jgi:pentapeptide repeat protein
VSSHQGANDLPLRCRVLLTTEGQHRKHTRRKACASEWFFKEKEGKRYCVLHYPGDEKMADFQTALNKKLAAKDYNFNGIWFPKNISFTKLHFDGDADFRFAIFGGNADFRYASFSGNADFRSASFGVEADFSSASFSGDTVFISSRFSGNADFRNAGFNAEAKFGFASFSKDAIFISSNFSATLDFSAASFSGVADFDGAIFSADTFFKFAKFKDKVYFVGQAKRRGFGDLIQLTFQYATFEKPDRISFHSLDLKPHWFVNVDPRKFEFIDVEFNYNLKDELKKLKKAGVSAPHRLLEIACRQLAVNAEENHRYGQAAE